MRDPLHMARRFLEDRRGATSVEYVVIATCIFLAIVTGVTAVGSKLTAIFPAISNSLQ